MSFSLDNLQILTDYKLCIYKLDDGKKIVTWSLFSAHINSNSMNSKAILGCSFYHPDLDLENARDRRAIVLFP